MVADPSRRCVCGYRRFRERRTPEVSTVERWMQFDPDDLTGGFGATPFGTFFGAGDGAGSSWGLFSGSYQAANELVVCESCQRTRSSRRLGGIAVFGSYVSGGWVYIAAADVLLPPVCYELRFDTLTQSYTVPLNFAAGAPPAIAAAAPPITAVSPPAGASTVDTLLRARLPEVVETGTFTVTLVDRCCGCETVLATLELEATPMIIIPQHADLGGYPERWVGMQLTGPTQPASRSRYGIPLEYCEEVLEYDARFGTLPSAQGWTHMTAAAGAPSDFQLVEGGALRLLGPGGGDDTYWEATTALAGAPTTVSAYAHYRVDVAAVTPAVGEGLSFQGLYAANAGAYRGVRWDARGANGLRITEIDGLADVEWTAGLHPDRGWQNTAMEHTAALMAHGIHNGEYDGPGSGLSFGSLAGPAAQDEMVGRFGDVVGEGMTTYIRNFVVSTPGRFCRAWFSAYSQVSTPRLRLFLASDLPATTDKGARFRVRYGPGTAAPHAMPTTVVDVTANFTAANTMYEVGVDLSGLTANSPFWFTVERDWSHVDDTLQATAWLYQATVRLS